MLLQLKLFALSSWTWLRPKLKWIALLLLAIGTGGLVRKLRRRHSLPTLPIGPRDDAALADAIRPGMVERAERARREAEEHKAFAEQRITEAQAERERLDRMSPTELLKESSAFARKVRERQRSRKPLLLPLAFAWLLSGIAHAQESLPYQLIDPSTGEHGWYIPDDVWREALSMAVELEALQEALPRFKQALAARELESEELKRQIEFERTVSSTLTVKLEAADLRLERAGRWYRSPKFLVPLGVALGAAGVLVPALVVP